MNNKDKDLLFDARLCPSVYISTFEAQKEELMLQSGSNNYIFTSLHMSEEIKNSEFRCKTAEMCRFLKEYGYKIVADISKKSLDVFQQDDVVSIAKALGIDIVRLDYGFDKKEILDISQRMPTALNASIISLDTFEELSKETKIIAIHNFYPRPETGLNKEKFDEINLKLKQLKIPVFAFIAGDLDKRQPIYEGLPTLESHRYKLPLVSYCDLVVNHNIDGVFIGDGFISKKQELLIKSFIKNRIMPLPTRFLEEYRFVFDRLFTVREDSPKHCLRIKESREYSCQGEEIIPDKQVERRKGAITMDNKLYKRYSGEIQVMRETLPMDKKVNVIGRISPEYFELLNCIKNGKKFMFIDENNI